MPWNLFSTPEVIHYTIDSLAGFIGPVYGVMIVDYYLVKGRHVNVRAMFSLDKRDPYWYTHGVNLKAVIALVPAAILSILAILSPDEWGISNFSFFIGSITAAFAYWQLSSKKTH